MSDCKAQKEREGLVDIKAGLNRIYTLVKGLESTTNQMREEAGVARATPQDKNESQTPNDPSVLIQVEDMVTDLEPRLEALTKNLDYLRYRTFGHSTTKTSSG